MTGYRQNNATLVSYDPGKARNGPQGQIAHTRPIIVQCTQQSRSPSLRSLGRKRRLWDNPSQK